MYRIPVKEIKEKIIVSGKLKAEELDLKIKAKINELSGLISEEGAAHIIANELGVELVNSDQTRLKIKEIYAGMRSVTTIGKVLRKFEVREFQKGNSQGKVCSLIIGDETGTIRVVFWNEQVEKLAKINEEDVLLIKEAYARENNGNKEIHLGERGEIVINPENEVITVVRQGVGSAFERRKIGDLTDGNEGVEIFGTVVQIFDPRFFYLCPECGKKVSESEGVFVCGDHQVVQPVISYVLNLILDDGTGNIRSTFWKNQVHHLLSQEEKEILIYKEDLAKFEAVKTELLGEQFKLMGRVKRNAMFDRLEFNVQLVEKANPQEEIARLEKIKS